MKIIYKDFDIVVKREERIEDKPLCYSITRRGDGVVVVAGNSYEDRSIKLFMAFLKDIVDDFLDDPQAYYKGEEELLLEEEEVEEL